MKLKVPSPSSISGKTVLVRVDYNVPLISKDGQLQVADDNRITASLKTINFLIKNQAKVILCSHLGRPKGKVKAALSLAPVAKHLKKMVQTQVSFSPDCIGEVAKEAVDKLQPGEILVLENLRFHSGEKKNEAAFSKALAGLADVYINDAFSTAHREHASIVGVPKYLPAFAGFAFEKEVETLNKLLTDPKRPFVMVIGGAKISDKVDATKHLSEIADAILIGGGTANNFLKAEGLETYKSLLEEKTPGKDKKKVNYVKVAEEMIDSTRTDKILIDGYIPLPKIVIPTDAVAATSPKSKKTEIIELINGNDEEAKKRNLMYLDIGPKTIRLFKEVILKAGTIFWNGPMGVFEEKLFAEGTEEIAKAIAKSGAETILGGGDTVAAINKFHLENRYDYISAAGGAALEFLSGVDLPGVTALRKK